jgi:hypothetical protein
LYTYGFYTLGFVVPENILFSSFLPFLKGEYFLV